MSRPSTNAGRGVAARETLLWVGGDGGEPDDGECVNPENSWWVISLLPTAMSCGINRRYLGCSIGYFCAFGYHLPGVDIHVQIYGSEPWICRRRVHSLPDDIASSSHSIT